MASLNLRDLDSLSETQMEIKRDSNGTTFDSPHSSNVDTSSFGETTKGFVQIIT